MDSTALNHEKLEYASLTRDPVSQQVEFRILSDKEIDDLVARTDLESDKGDDDIPASSSSTTSSRPVDDDD